MRMKNNLIHLQFNNFMIPVRFTNKRSTPNANKVKLIHICSVIEFIAII